MAHPFSILPLATASGTAPAAASVGALATAPTPAVAAASAGISAPAPAKALASVPASATFFAAPTATLAPWQDVLRTSLRSFADLVAAGLVPAQQVEALRARFGHLQLGIPRPYAARFSRSLGEACPLWRQAVPWAAEDDPVLPAWAEALSQKTYGRRVPWAADAIGDVARLAAPRLTHRYPKRALVHVTAACALYCRFCFRKSHLSSKEAALYAGSLQPAWDYLAAHTEVDEVILSGGDPLSMSDAWWQRTLAALAHIPHLKTLRIHSRMPATVPQRLTPRLCALWATARQQVVLVSHFNHPRELSPAALAHLKAVRCAGVLTLNQAVLLRGVNDSSAVLAALMRRLYQGGVQPYYLHHPDYTPNTWGFRLSVARGRRLVRRALAQLSGPMRPRYMLELPPGHGKVDLLSAGQGRAASGRQRDEEAGLGAATYTFVAPQTRHSAPASHTYLDLYPLRRTSAARMAHR